MGNTLEVQPQPNDAPAYKAMSALCHALYELDRVAIVRYCRTNSTGPPPPPPRAGAVSATNLCFGFPGSMTNRPPATQARRTHAPHSRRLRMLAVLGPTVRRGRTPLHVRPAFTPALLRNHRAHACHTRTACAKPPCSFASFKKVQLTPEQLDATDAFIYALDLMTTGRDSDGYCLRAQKETRLRYA